MRRDTASRVTGICAVRLTLRFRRCILSRPHSSTAELQRDEIGAVLQCQPRTTCNVLQSFVSQESNAINGGKRRCHRRDVYAGAGLRQKPLLHIFIVFDLLYRLTSRPHHLAVYHRRSEQ